MLFDSFYIMLNIVIDFYGKQKIYFALSIQIFANCESTVDLMLKILF